MKAGHGSIDWDEVRRVIRESEAELQRSLSPDQESVSAVFRARAAAFARPLPEPSGRRKPVLVFELGPGQYGLELSALRHVQAMPACTPLPGGRTLCLGILNLGGRIGPLVDLATLLGLPGRPEPVDPHILLLRESNWRGALRVDRMVGISWFEESMRTLSGATQTGMGLFKGIIPDSIFVLDSAELSKQLLFKEGSEA